MQSPKEQNDEFGEFLEFGLTGPEAKPVLPRADDYVYDDGLDPITNFCLKYRWSPVEFARDVLNFEALPWQCELMNAIAAGERLTSVRASHGVGKTAGVAILAIWKLAVGHDGAVKVVITAPTHSQLNDGLLSEIKTWLKKAPDFLRELFEVQADRIYHKGAPESVFLAARVSSQNTPESLAGIHADSVLIIADEASGIPDAIFHSARGSMSSLGAATILISNPTRNSGFFYDTHHALAFNWKTMHVSCVDNPLVSPDFAKEFAGEDDPQYQIRYLGEFPRAEADTLIGAELVDSAMARDLVMDDAADTIWGLDCARFGDDRSVLCIRKGNVVVEFLSWKGLDSMQLVGIIAQKARAENPTVIAIDSIGLGGPIADRLRELALPVRDVNVTEVSAMNPQAAKLRDELWLAIKTWLEKRACKLPKNPDLRRELVAPTYEYLSNGKLKVESKEMIRKRLHNSPDLADALALTFAVDAAFVGGTAPRWIKGQPLKRNLGAVV